MAIADADGLAAVSMQRVAGRLDVTKMALYRYVANKAQLLAVMIEAAVGEPPDLHGVAGAALDSTAASRCTPCSSSAVTSVTPGR